MYWQATIRLFRQCKSSRPGYTRPLPWFSRQDGASRVWRPKTFRQLPTPTKFTVMPSMCCKAGSSHWMGATSSSCVPHGILSGFSVNKADVGDQIWQFDGADVLFVCRTSQNGMILISECYLWGFSYHECCQWEPCRADEAVGCNHCNGFRHMPVMSTSLH